MKITVVEQSELTKDDFKAPSKYYFINALGQAVFLHARARGDAEAYIKEEYGSGFYKLRTSSLDKPKGDVTVRGTQTVRGQRR